MTAEGATRISKWKTVKNHRIKLSECYVLLKILTIGKAAVIKADFFLFMELR